MIKMLVSHESPLCLLEQSRMYNDTDYALVHLFERYPKYYEFFYNSRHIYNREILLDNSLFELKKAFDPDKFKVWIEKLQPNCYIIPDALEDAELTVEQCGEWLGTQGITGWAKKARKIGVVQGRTFQELVECYKFMLDNVDQIAISFDYSFYLQIGLGKTDLEKYASGRQMFITMLINENIWNWTKPIHLLGASKISEFRWYIDNNIYNIGSCDTSSPIMCGIKGIRYDADLGNATKPTDKLADNLEIELTADQKELIQYNIEQFKRVLRR